MREKGSENPKPSPGFEPNNPRIQGRDARQYITELCWSPPYCLSKPLSNTNRPDFGFCSQGSKGFKP